MLFDFVEEMHEKAEPFVQAIRDACRAGWPVGYLTGGER